VAPAQAAAAGSRHPEHTDRGLTVPDRDARALAVAIFDEVTAAVDGEALVRGAGRELAAAGALGAATHVLAVGKAAFPMLAGARAVAGGRPGRPGRPTLAVAPAARVPAATPPGVEVRAADHPQPSNRSVAAAIAARAFVAGLGAGDRLLVLLSGGASALLCAPAPPLTLDDKRAAVAAVAAGGAPIAALNAVRKHLSAIKGGQLALATRAPVTVMALSDVIGDDPATIGSGPLSGDPTSYGDALAAVAASGAAIPEAARLRLERGRRGEIEETPKPGDPRLAHVAYTVIAGPRRVAEEARRAAEARGLGTGRLARDTELEVGALAAAYVARALDEAAAGGPPRALVGNGEPVIRLGAAAAGTGGRATHLALMVARGLQALPQGMRARVAFLAAGTDDRDGNTPVAGAVVDGESWVRAAAAGADPEAALERFDSFHALRAAGATVRGPGTSNLLDLHLLVLL
jgi:glycerate 2-kinase